MQSEVTFEWQIRGKHWDRWDITASILEGNVFHKNIFHFLLLSSRFVHRTLYTINFSGIDKSYHDLSPPKLTGILIDLLWEQSLRLCSHALQVFDGQVFSELYGILSVAAGFFRLTSATNHMPEANYVHACMVQPYIPSSLPPYVTPWDATQGYKGAGVTLLQD
jgi:hypothetical protein